MEGDKGTVCVTGGTGFIASWLIKRLLEHGYSVHTTIRPADPDPERKRDVTFLTNLPGASEKLKIFHADLSDPNSFDVAIGGCTGVFHVATTIDFENKEPEEIVTRRTVDGTLGILKSCLKAKTVKRVVYTSSAVAVVYNQSGAKMMDESFWSDVDYIKTLNASSGTYCISKTSTEKAALEFAEEHGLDLVTAIPPYVGGPFICPKFPNSVRLLLAMVLGNKETYGLFFNAPMAHVDDVVWAHIFLFENPKAKGRYICSSDTITLEEMSKFLSTRYPQFSIPSVESLKNVKGYKNPIISSQKLLNSGFNFSKGLAEIFDEVIQCCQEKGFL